MTFFASAQFILVAMPIGLEACYGACGIAWAGCYSAAGLAAGTVVASPAAPAAALACNAAEGLCMAACTRVGLTNGSIVAIPVFGLALQAAWKMYKSAPAPKL